MSLVCCYVKATLVFLVALLGKWYVRYVSIHAAQRKIPQPHNI